ncbi:orotate phosphoribosyltransferase [bacterium]
MVDIKKVFFECGALFEGHFLLSSGLHSSCYMQSAKVLQNPKNAEMFGELIAEKIKEIGLIPDLVVAPAMGGLIVGHEVARALGLDFVFTERVEGQMTIRRGFKIEEGMKILIVEDVFTTGKSTREVIDLINSNKAQVIGCASIVDRSGGQVDFGMPKISLLTLDIKNYEPNDCPLCKEGLPVEKPGSRKIF